ncbi:MAG TPA: hypothetical protein VHE77_07460 [Dongiaceae bacterium]|nr:hypothetical protein [Dongiaceae bacterium]
MPPIPIEFEELLTPAGRRVLAGKAPDISGALADPKRRFVALEGMIRKSAAAALRKVLEREMLPLLRPMAVPIPPETIWEMEKNYEEWLPKAVRVKTATLENRRAKSWHCAEALGLIDLLSSESFFAFAEAIAGRPVRRKVGQQLLCYGPGDYAGPHNDHHPEDKGYEKGYLDIHLSLSSPAVAHQYLVYAKAGHFTEMVPVSGLGTITAYRLPFWHYTTPLMPKPGRDKDARRWVLLGTFGFRAT